jgi:hypothetical protein
MIPQVTLCLHQSIEVVHWALIILTLELDRDSVYSESWGLLWAYEFARHQCGHLLEALEIDDFSWSSLELGNERKNIYAHPSTEVDAFLASLWSFPLSWRWHKRVPHTQASRSESSAVIHIPCTLKAPLQRQIVDGVQLFEMTLRQFQPRFLPDVC